MEQQHKPKQIRKKRGKYKKLSFRGQLPTGPVGNPDKLLKFTEEQIKEQEQVFLKNMGSGLSFESVAAELGIGVTTLYNYLSKYPELQKIKDRGEALSLRHWETILVNGAMGNIKGFNAVAAIFAMKNKFNRLYKDKVEVESTNYNIYELRDIDESRYIDTLKGDKFIIAESSEVDEESPKKQLKVSEK